MSNCTRPARSPILAGLLAAALTSCGGGGGGSNSGPAPAGNLHMTTLRAVSDVPTTAHEVMLATGLSSTHEMADVAVEYFLMNKEDVDAGAAEVRQFEVASSVFEKVTAGTAEYQSVVTIPQDVEPAGDYYLVAQVDPENVIAETDEDDNMPTSTSKVIVRIDDRNSATADVVMESAAVDLDAVILWPARPLHDLGTTKDEQNHDFGATVIMTTTGRNEVDNVDLSASLEIPGQGVHRLQFWNKEATSYDNRYFTSIQPGIPNTVHLDMVLPENVRRLVDGHIRANRGNTFKLVVSSNQLRNVAEWEMGSRRFAQRTDNDVETEVVIIPPPPGVSKGFGWEGDYQKNWNGKHIGIGVDFRGAMAFDRNGATATAGAGIPLQLFGLRTRLLDFTAFGHVLPKENQPTESQFDLDMKVFGQSLYSRSSTDPAYQKTWDWNVTRSTKQEKLLFVGPVPVSVAAGASATLGFRVDVHLDPAQFILEAGPYANAKAFAEAGVELLVVKVGVRGDVTLIDDVFTAKAAAGLSIPQTGFLSGDILLEVTNVLQGPQGRLYLFADRRVPKFCHEVIPCGIKTITDTLTLVKFTSFKKTDVLYQNSDSTVVQL